MERLGYYLRIWLVMNKNSFLSVFAQRVGFLIFLTGKILRFGVFLLFLIFLVKGTETIAGFDVNQALFFFLTFNLIDVMAQFLFREVYRFRTQVVSGSFDIVLTKPVNSLFRILLGGADVIDFVTIPPLIIAVFLVGKSLNPTLLNTIIYILLIFNGLIIAAAFHIAVMALGILTLEIDHTIMIYRDLVALGKFPVDIYKEPLRGALTFLIPVGIMVTFPAKVLMGLLSPVGILVSFGFGVTSILIAIRFWNYALRYYASASS